MASLEYGSQSLEFELCFADRKTMAIEVHPDKSIVVKAPTGTERIDIEEKLIKRARWIIRQQKFFDQFLPRTPQRSYVRGESHYYLGKKYVLKLREGSRKEVKLKGGEIQITAPSVAPEAVKPLLSSWYYNHAMPKFREVFEASLPLFRWFDIGTPPLEIRRMKNRWGSCTPGGKIMLNPELIKAPKRCIEYVAIHELCHLVHPNHTRSFYALQEEIMPDWKKWKGKLESTLT